MPWSTAWPARSGDSGPTIRTRPELTHAQRAYDYQPDVARDARSVVFTRYDGDAMELWRLDLGSGREQQLTSGRRGQRRTAPVA